MQGLKFNQSAVYGNLQYTSNYLQYESNYTKNINMENILGQPLNQLVGNRANSSGEGPTDLQKNKTERLTINIMGWLFPLLVWNRPSLSSCGKGPAHLENSKEKIS